MRAPAIAAAWPRPILPESDREFLARRGVPEEFLKTAEQRAASHGTGLLPELFALGFDQQEYWSMLADDLGLRFSKTLAGATLIPDFETTRD